ncbi:MAG: hypothetical protein Aurels2KO_41070 [Aureliella sp.]
MDDCFRQNLATLDDYFHFPEDLGDCRLQADSAERHLYLAGLADYFRPQVARLESWADSRSECLDAATAYWAVKHSDATR